MSRRAGLSAARRAARSPGSRRRPVFAPAAPTRCRCTFVLHSFLPSDGYGPAVLVLRVARLDRADPLVQLGARRAGHADVRADRRRNAVRRDDLGDGRDDDRGADRGDLGANDASVRARAHTHATHTRTTARPCSSLARVVVAKETRRGESEVDPHLVWDDASPHRHRYRRHDHHRDRPRRTRRSRPRRARSAGARTACRTPSRPGRAATCS